MKVSGEFNNGGAVIEQLKKQSLNNDVICNMNS